LVYCATLFLPRRSIILGNYCVAMASSPAPRLGDSRSLDDDAALAAHVGFCLLELALAIGGRSAHGRAGL
jgi:hypothetical protein